MTGKSTNVVYLCICNHDDHNNGWYIGSAKNICERWRNQRTDFINKNVTKCGFSRHAELRSPIPFIKMTLLESLGVDATEQQLIRREVWWQTNVGTLFFGLNKRKDLNIASFQGSRVNFGND